jgi:large subunit ribosomal protein L7/L12
MNQNINQIIEILKSLTLLETIQLVNEIKETFNINITNEIINNNEQDLNLNSDLIIEDKSLFNITIIEIPLDKKISILKIVRNITGLGLKESKDIVDNIPKVLKENITKEEVEKIKIELESLGAKVKIS